MRIQWEIDDGYTGRNRPHFLNIDDDELEDYETEEEREQFIEECVKEEFENTIDYYWKIV